MVDDNSPQPASPTSPHVVPKTLREVVAKVRPLAEGAWLLLLGIPLFLYARRSARLGRWIVDDAGITFAYARSLVDGHGFAQQPGAPQVEGYSNPTWLVLLAIGKALRVFDSGTTIFGVPDYVWFPKALGAICFAGTVFACFTVVRACFGQRVAACAAAGSGAILASIPSYVIWATSGLENSLYGLLAAWLSAVLALGVLAQDYRVDRRAVTASLLAVGCALTRPDGAIFVAAYPIGLLLGLHKRDDVRRTLRPLLLSVGSFVLLAGMCLLLRYAIFRAWLPNTAVAKGQSVPTFDVLRARMEEPLSYLGVGFCASAAATVGAALFGAGTSPQRKLQSLALGIALVPTLLSLAAFAVLNRDWMGELRFATPVWTTGVLVLGFAGAVVWSTREIGALARCSALLVLAWGSVASAPEFADRLDKFRKAPTVPLCVVADLYRVYHPVADILGIEKGTLVAPDLGGALLTSRFTLIDSAGLTEPFIARALRERDHGRINDYLLRTLKPTFIHKHGAWLKTIDGDPRFERDYVAFVDGNDYVRKDALNGREAQLDVARNEASDYFAAVDAFHERHPRASCGERLLVGSNSEEGAAGVRRRP